jgi:type IV secretory pathway TrbL component
LPWEEFETILSTWFKQARTTNTSIDGSHLKEAALHITVFLGTDGFWASIGWMDCFNL